MVGATMLKVNNLGKALSLSRYHPQKNEGKELCTTTTTTAVENAHLGGSLDTAVFWRSKER